MRLLQFISKLHLRNFERAIRATLAKMVKDWRTVHNKLGRVLHGCHSDAGWQRGPGMSKRIIFVLFSYKSTSILVVNTYAEKP
jgi:hypothetical protein